jgi:hypothetical protein
LLAVSGNKMLLVGGNNKYLHDLGCSAQSLCNVETRELNWPVVMDLEIGVAEDSTAWARMRKFQLHRSIFKSSHCSLLHYLSVEPTKSYIIVSIKQHIEQYDLHHSCLQLIKLLNRNKTTWQHV